MRTQPALPYPHSTKVQRESVIRPPASARIAEPEHECFSICLPGRPCDPQLPTFYAWQLHLMPAAI